MMQTHLYDINKSHLCEVGFLKYKTFYQNGENLMDF